MGVLTAKALPAYAEYGSLSRMIHNEITTEWYAVNISRQQLRSGCHRFSHGKKLGSMLEESEFLL